MYRYLNVFPHALIAESAVDFRVNYPMIKYPRRVLGLPNEKLFKMDTHNMVCLQLLVLHEGVGLDIHNYFVIVYSDNVSL